MKPRIIYIAACGIVLAAIVHICIIFFIPLYGEKDAARRIMQNSQTGRFEALTDNSSFGHSTSDPYFQIATCKFDLAMRGIEVQGINTELFWSASVFSARGRVIYSLNKRSAIGNKLRMIVVNPVQMANIRQIQPAELATSIVIETGEQTGFVIVRVLLPDNSWKSTVDDFIKRLSCKPYSEL